jgi:hypothetical protein
VSAVDVLRAATPSTTTVTICMDGAAQAEWDQIQSELQDVDTTSDSLARSAVSDIADRLDEVRERVKASEVTFMFERLGPWEEIALRADHPPRDKNPIDGIRGFNVETYYAALIRATCTSVTKRGSDESEPVPDDVWDGLLGAPAETDAEGKVVTPAVRGSLNTRQVNDLIAACEKVNGGETTVPPSARSLLESQDFGASLAQPSPGQEAPRNGSAGGKRRTSPSTSTTKKAPSKGSSSGR